jgi:hypothetical protein
MVKKIWSGVIMMVLIVAVGCRPDKQASGNMKYTGLTLRWKPSGVEKVVDLSLDSSTFSLATGQVVSFVVANPSKGKKYGVRIKAGQSLGSGKGEELAVVTGTPSKIVNGLYEVRITTTKPIYPVKSTEIAAADVAQTQVVFELYDKDKEAKVLASTTVTFSWANGKQAVAK